MLKVVPVFTRRLTGSVQVKWGPSTRTSNGRRHNTPSPTMGPGCALSPSRPEVCHNHLLNGRFKNNVHLVPFLFYYYTILLLCNKK